MKWKNRFLIVENNISQLFKLFQKIFDIEKNEYKIIIKGDHKLNRIPDLSHPILAWHPNVNVLAIFEEKKGDIVLNLYDIKNKQGLVLAIEPMINLGKKEVTQGANNKPILAAIMWLLHWRIPFLLIFTRNIS